MCGSLIHWLHINYIQTNQWVGFYAFLSFSCMFQIAMWMVRTLFGTPVMRITRPPPSGRRNGHQAMRMWPSIGCPMTTNWWSVPLSFWQSLSLTDPFITSVRVMQGTDLLIISPSVHNATRSKAYWESLCLSCLWRMIRHTLERGCSHATPKRVYLVLWTLWMAFCAPSWRLEAQS